MDEYERRQLYQADSLVNWSFLGIIAPLIGWILAGVARSKVIRLPDAETKSDQRVVNDVFHKFKISLTLSIISFVLYCVGTILGVIYIANQRAATLEAAAETQNSSCIQQIEQVNAKVNELNATYSSDVLGASFMYATNLSVCGSGLESALVIADSNYQSSLAAVQNRCTIQAQKDYKTNWDADVKYLGTDGRLPAANAQQHEDRLTTAKDECYRRFSAQ